MAGYTLGFDDGGAVDDETPTIPTDDQAPADVSGDTGASPSPEAAQQPQNDSGFVPGGAPGLGQQVNSGVKKIVSYLMGAGAADPQTAKKFEQGVKQENPGISDDDANLLAVHQAHEMGGPAAAWQMVQYNRMAYNAKTAFARAALNGVDGKAGNIQAAAQAASQASSHVLDGSQAYYTADPSGSGVTATVKMPGTDRTLNFKLNPQQFNQWLDVGGAGMWDKVMENGTPQALQQASQGGAATPSSTPDAADAATPPAVGKAPAEDQTDASIRSANEDNQDSDPETPEANPNAGQPTNIGTTPSSLNLGNPNQPNTLPPKPYSYGNDIEAQGRAMYPNISDESKRQAFMAQQQNQRSTRINELGKSAMGARAKENVARATGAARVQSATVGSENRATGQVQAAEARAGGQRDAATIKAKADADKARQQAILATTKMMQSSQDAQMRERGRQFRAELTNPNKVITSPDEVAALAKKYGINGVAPQQAAPEQPAGQEAAPAASPQARPANVPQGAKFYQGKWYTRGQNGEAVEVPAGQ